MNTIKLQWNYKMNHCNFIVITMKLQWFHKMEYCSAIVITMKLQWHYNITDVSLRFQCNFMVIVLRFHWTAMWMQWHYSWTIARDLQWTCNKHTSLYWQHNYHSTVKGLLQCHWYFIDIPMRFHCNLAANTIARSQYRSETRFGFKWNCSDIFETHVTNVVMR